MSVSTSAILLFICSIVGYECAKILVVAPVPAYSHNSIPARLAKELASRGHQVTCINAFPQRQPLANYTDVSIVENIKIIDAERKKLFEQGNRTILENLTSLFDFTLAIVEAALSAKNVKKLLHSDEQFDVVILEYFFDDALVGLGRRFKAPIILISTVSASALNNHVFYNPAPLSYVPGKGGKLTSRMNFWQRLENLILHSIFTALMHFYHLPKQREVFERHFGSDVKMDEVLHNTSLLLTNSHVSVSYPVPLVPSIVEIGGFHIDPKPLPGELQKFLDEAEEGVVLFSMGSNLRSDDFTPQLRAEILGALSKIKQKVLWKFEADLSDAPANVKIMHWLPQQDVLGHPNVKAFITHGGFLSNLEAVYFGVPIIGIPVFGDQAHNVAAAVQTGYGVEIALKELSEKTLSRALDEVLNNNKYREIAQYRSKLMHDQPLKPIDSAVYWVEHVIRHKGGSHLRTTGVDLKWYEREMLDVYLFLALVTIAVLTTIYWSVKKLWRVVGKKKSIKSSKKKQ